MNDYSEHHSYDADTDPRFQVRYFGPKLDGTGELRIRNLYAITRSEANELRNAAARVGGVGHVVDLGA